MEIKDLILKTEETVDVENSNEEVQVVKKKPTITYELKICSGCDLAIERTTSRSSSLLVLLLSQKQYYIKTGDNIEPLDATNYTKFFASIEERFDLPTGVGGICNWTKSLVKGKAAGENLICFLANETFVELAKKNLITPAVYEDTSLFRCTVDLYTENPALYTYMFNAAKNCSNFNIINSNFAEMALSLAKNLSLEYAKFFIDFLIHSPLLESICLKYSIPAEENIFLSKNFFIPLTSYNSRVGRATGNLASNGVVFEPKSFINYITYEACAQGFANNINYFLSSWNDTLMLQLFIFGKIKEKYPKNLMSLHSKLSYLSYQKKKSYDEKKWAEAVKNMEPLEYKGVKYSIICPKTPEDMRDEAQQQGNCLVGYIDNVTNGYEKIFFLRDNNNLSASLVTIEVYNDGRIGQVCAAHNKTPKEAVLNFVAKWAGEKGLIWDGKSEAIHAARNFEANPDSSESEDVA